MSDRSITFSTDPDTAGFPAVMDGAFTAAVQGSKRGGDATAAFFDQLNRTSDFWGDLADGAITFAPAVDPWGRPVYSAANDNVELRLVAEYVDGGGLTGDVVGRATIAARVTASGIAHWTALAVRVARMPPYLKLTPEVFDRLLLPVYRSTSTLLIDLAAKIQARTRVATPVVDALETAVDATADAGRIIEDVGPEIGAEGVESMSIRWDAAVLDMAGIAPLMALPILSEELGHTMSHSLVVQNLTDRDFTWDIHVEQGRTALEPGHQLLPGLADVEGVRLSSSVSLQHVNTTDYSSVGFALGLQPDDGGPAATLVVDVPWGGHNTIWVGTAEDLPEAWDQHAGAPNGLSTSAVFGDYRVTLSLNKLNGTTEDSYFYCSTAVIEPARAF